MQLTDLLAGSGGLQAMARELGLSDADAERGAEALAPAVLGGFRKQAASKASAPGGLAGMLEQLGGGGLLDDVLAPEPTSVGRGNDVLGQIFGSRDVSRAVADDAASRSGLDAGTLKKMLPILTMLISGYMARQAGAGNAAAAPAPSAGGGLGDLLGSVLGGTGAGQEQGGLASLLDMNGDGNPLDDILRMAGKAMR